MNMYDVFKLFRVVIRLFAVLAIRSLIAYDNIRILLSFPCTLFK